MAHDEALVWPVRILLLRRQGGVEHDCGERACHQSSKSSETAWSDKEFLFSHIEDTQMFQESQPYHSVLMTKGQRFEIYMQAFRVIDKAHFLEQAKLLYLAMPKKSEAGWDTVDV